MRLAVVLALALTLSGCTWIERQVGPETGVAPPGGTTPAPKPEPVKPHKVARPVPPQAPASAIPVAAPPPADNSARCREMAENRADDAKELGVSDPDRQKLRDDTYRSCMAPPVKGAD